MLLSGTIYKSESHGRLLSLATLAIGSLLFGIMSVFGWHRLLHGGIGIVFGIVLVAFFTLALAARRARRRTEVASKPR